MSIYDDALDGGTRQQNYIAGRTQLVDVPANLVAGQILGPIQILDARFTRPKPITITLVPPQQYTAVVPAPPQPATVHWVAHLRYATFGVAADALLDWRNGVVASINVDYISLDVVGSVRAGGARPQSWPAQMPFAGMIAEGVRATSPARRTVELLTAKDAPMLLGATLDVPLAGNNNTISATSNWYTFTPLAKRMQICATPANAVVQVDFYNTTGLLASGPIVVAWPSAWVDLLGSTSALRITNGGPALTSLALLFELDL